MCFYVGEDKNSLQTRIKSLQGGSVLLLPEGLKPQQEWFGVSFPFTQMLQHQLNSPAAPRGQDLSAWMQTEKDFLKCVYDVVFFSFFFFSPPSLKMLLYLNVQVLHNSWLDFQGKG